LGCGFLWPTNFTTVCSFSLWHFYFLFAVFFDCLKACAVGAPGDPTFRIFSLLPAAIRRFLAAMLAYSPAFAMIFSFLAVIN